jgi:hypothetical protein
VSVGDSLQYNTAPCDGATGKMIRRDYLLLAIEELIEALSRIRALKESRRWEEADVGLDDQFRRLMGTGARDAVRLSDVELLARLIQGGSTHEVRDKTLMLAALLKEAGDVAAAQDRDDESSAYWQRGLHLLLEMEEREGVFERPEFVPSVEAFAIALRSASLPSPTYARLMRHYELTGEFAKAEDALYALLDAEPQNAAVVQFGIGFYERLQAKSDDTLAAGNLPRSEIDAALADLRGRRL